MQTQFNIQHELLAISSLDARLHGLLFLECQPWLRLSFGNDNYFLVVIPNNILYIGNSTGYLLGSPKLFAPRWQNSSVSTNSTPLVTDAVRSQNYCQSLNNPSNEVSLSSSGLIQLPL